MPESGTAFLHCSKYPCVPAWAAFLSPVDDFGNQDSKRSNLQTKTMQTRPGTQQINCWNLWHLHFSTLEEEPQDCSFSEVLSWVLLASGRNGSRRVSCPSANMSNDLPVGVAGEGQAGRYASCGSGQASSPVASTSQLC